MFLTAAGKMRRIDLIFVPKPEFAFGYLGWVRSTPAHALVARDFLLSSQHVVLFPESGAGSQDPVRP